MKFGLGKDFTGNVAGNIVFESRFQNLEDD